MLDVDISRPPDGTGADELRISMAYAFLEIPKRRRTVSLAGSQEPSEPTTIASRYAGLPAALSDSRMGWYFNNFALRAATRES
ncbi:hypothetical protein TNCV_5006001 [Trichonephila clavipes]|nr:hypothetical protein TNCV_5006001 [Trichonephila clavipes]